MDQVLDLGATPLANAFLRRTQLAEPEPRFPLEVVRCRVCGLVQLAHVVPPDQMFRDYVYFTSSSRTMPLHFAKMVGTARRSYGKTRRGLALDIGSNDGSLLKNLLGTNLDVLGIEPARNVAKAANAAGIRTWNAYFSRRLARRIRSSLGPARLVFSTNVLAHIDDVHDVVAGVADLLEDDGAWVIEVPHLADLVRKTEFDTIYHEHLSYFSMPPVRALLEQHDLSIVRVDRVPVHGGSLRLTVRRAGARPGDSVRRVEAYEARLDLDRPATYTAFRRRVADVTFELPRMLAALRARGARVVGYGAPAKGNTLLNVCGIGPDHLEYVLDTTPAKQGLFTPGSHLPVVPPDEFHRHPPDYALLLAWNFEPEILRKERDYLHAGGRFIRPIPFPSVVPARGPAPVGSRPSATRPLVVGPFGEAPPAGRAAVLGTSSRTRRGRRAPA